MSDLLELYVALERDEETEGVPTDRRIMAAFAELHRDGIGYPYTPIQIAIVADCEPDEVTALAESMGSAWPLDGDGYPRVRQTVFAWGAALGRRRRRRDEARAMAESVKELYRFRRTFLSAKGWA